MRGAALGLVGDHHHRSGFDPQPAADLFVERSHALARVDQQDRHVRVTHRRFGLPPHPPREGRRGFVLEAGGVDQPEIEAKQPRLGLAPVAGHPGLIVDQREALPDQPIEQGRFPDVGPADDRDGGERHGNALTAPLSLRERVYR